MSVRSDDLSDKALSIFAFAIYRELDSGERVKAIALHDDSGHGAPPEGVRELQDQGLATTAAEQVEFTSEGERMLEAMASRLRDAATSRQNV